MNRPRSSVFVEASGTDGGARPDIEIHQLCVGLKPVSKLVFGREEWPGRGEFEVWHVANVDRVMEHERLVALTPIVANSGVTVDDEVGNTELVQASGEVQACLT